MTDKKHDLNTVVRVGMTAGVVGAAAGALAVSLSDKKNRKKVANQLDKMKEWGDKTLTEMKKDAKTVKMDMSDKADDIVKDVDKKATKLQNEAEETKKQTTKQLK